MTKTRRKHINELVEIIREEANLSAPVTLEQLKEFVTKDLEGQIVEEDLFDDRDGQINKTEDSFIITLNNSNYSSEKRQKFTLAHELGHLFLHMGFLNKDKWEKTEDYEDTVYARSGYSEEEYDAHEFAAALLMPKDKYAEIVNDNSENGKCDISIIADYFDVSEQAASNRGKWLGIFKW
jgi:Zn-dependent peptidase ImmA (M78 family)